ncbi:MAG: leucine-rich repeat domain-containing protein, partial [Pedobacter sp.]
MKNINLFYLLIALSCILGGCTAEGLTGPEGPTGQSGAKGETGAVGPAGKDGSVMYSGVGVPGMSIGVAGDYYLDKATGSLYGPKVVAGWGAPIVLV